MMTVYEPCGRSDITLREPQEDRLMAMIPSRPENALITVEFV